MQLIPIKRADLYRSGLTALMIYYDSSYEVFRSHTMKWTTNGYLKYLDHEDDWEPLYLDNYPTPKFFLVEDS